MKCFAALDECRTPLTRIKEIYRRDGLWDFLQEKH